MNLTKLTMIAILSTVAFVPRLQAQEAAYKWSIGASVGLGGYLGEYGSGGLFSSPGFAASLNYSYIANVRWEFSANLAMSSLSGKVDKASGQYPGMLPEKFGATAGELNVRAEFNFFPYGIGETYKRLKRWTPFIGAGIGVAGAKPKGSSFTVAPEFPLVFGFKYMLNERVNIRADFSATKTLTHGIDGVQDIYGVERSWFKGTDWLMSLQFGISYTFGERCPTCQYVD